MVWPLLVGGLMLQMMPSDHMQGACDGSGLRKDHTRLAMTGHVAMPPYWVRVGNIELHSSRRRVNTVLQVGARVIEVL